jgi:hypothetical protein
MQCFNLLNMLQIELNGVNVYVILKPKSQTILFLNLQKF